MCMEKSNDGTKYLVRDLHDKQTAADHLHSIRTMCFNIRDIVCKAFPNDPRSERFKANLKESATIFTEATPDSKFTSHTENKGEKIVFCLRQRDDKEKLVDMNTMKFVAIHELGHVITVSVGHTQEFWDNFKWLLEICEKHNIYKSVDYSKNPQE